MPNQFSVVHVRSLVVLQPTARFASLRFGLLETKPLLADVITTHLKFNGAELTVVILCNSISAGFRGWAKGPGPRAPHHVRVFSHICDMCVPLSHF